MTTFDDTVLGREAMELEGTAYWRSKKAIQYPEDGRNEEARKLLERLAIQLREIKGSQEAVAFNALHEFIFDGGTEEHDEPLEVSRLWSEYRSDIGFRRFPETGQEYLRDLMEIARDAS